MRDLSPQDATNCSAAMPMADSFMVSGLVGTSSSAASCSAARCQASGRNETGDLHVLSFPVNAKFYMQTEAWMLPGGFPVGQFSSLLKVNTSFRSHSLMEGSF